MHDMQTIVTDDCGVCLSRGSTRLHCAKAAELMKILFGVNILRGPRNIVLDRGADPLTARGRGQNVVNFGPTISQATLMLKT